MKFNINEWVEKQEKLVEKVDHIDDKEAATKFDDLKDKDVDNDGDSDESDEYLHKKLGTVAVKTEAAPKMKVAKYDVERKNALKSLNRFDNMVRMENPGAYSRNKTKIAKAMKALTDLRHLR